MKAAVAAGALAALAVAPQAHAAGHTYTGPSSSSRASCWR